MEHIDPEELDLLAVGGVLPDADQQAHLDSCSDCQGEFASLRRTAGAIRSSRDLSVSDAPSSVWSAIHAELRLDPSLVSPPHRGVLTDVPGTDVPGTDVPGTGPITDTRTGARTASGDVAIGAPTADGSTAPGATRPGAAAVVGRRTRPPGRRTRPRARGRRSTALIAALALVMGVVGGFGIARLVAPSDAGGSVLASARLAALPDWPDASGRATLRELADGSREVDVTIDAAAADGVDLREVWLLTSDASGLVSIGFLSGTEGTFRVPAGVDLAEYPIVDVSAEPFDGDPTHSGDSIVRGDLSGS